MIVCTRKRWKSGDNEMHFHLFSIEKKREHRVALEWKTLLSLMRYVERQMKVLPDDDDDAFVFGKYER